LKAIIPKFKKILLIRTDRIGDVILSLPLFSVLKNTYPDAQLDFIVNKRISELIENYPNINKVHSIENDSIKDIKLVCIQNKYDLAIAVHPTFKIALALYLARVKYRLGTGYRWYSLFFNIRHYQHRKYSLKHELEYNIDLLNEIHCKRPDNMAISLTVVPEIMENVKKKLLVTGIPVDQRFIIIHPVTLGSAKVWSKQNFINLIDLIHKDGDCEFNIFLTGTKEDDSDLNYIISRLQEKSNVYIVQDLNLKELAGLIKMAELFVSNSTGPIHIAAAVGTFAVGFYSTVLSERASRWAPYTNKKKIFIPQEDTKYEDKMDSIGPDEVFSFIKSYMMKVNSKTGL
jgi:ADP-heptose:LPS heptosyltransferase